MFYDNKAYFYIRFFYPRAIRLLFDGPAFLLILFDCCFFFASPLGFVFGPDATRNRFVFVRSPILVLKRVLNCSVEDIWMRKHATMQNGLSKRTCSPSSPILSFHCVLEVWYVVSDYYRHAISFWGGLFTTKKLEIPASSWIKYRK